MIWEINNAYYDIIRTVSIENTTRCLALLVVVVVVVVVAVHQMISCLVV